MPITQVATLPEKPEPGYGDVSVRPIADPNVVNRTKMAQAISAPARTAAQSTYACIGAVSVAAAVRSRALPISLMVFLPSLCGVSAQAEERKNGQDDDDESDEV